jgi:hypothetical protein
LSLALEPAILPFTLEVIFTLIFSSLGGQLCEINL